MPAPSCPRCPVYASLRSSDFDATDDVMLIRYNDVVFSDGRDEGEESIVSTHVNPRALKIVERGRPMTKKRAMLMAEKSVMKGLMAQQ